MFGMRSELREETQKAYGNYCNYTRNHGKDPMPYYLFSKYYLQGLSVKEIHKRS